MQLSPDISVLIPSRGRPDKLTRCLKSRGVHKNVEILIATNDDDPSYNISAIEGLGKVYTAPRSKTLAICINQLAAHAKGKLLFFLGDDYVINVPDWPDRILKSATKMPNDIGVLYPRCIFHKGFASLPIISRRMYEYLGYYMAPYFPFWYIDAWWDEIGEMLDAKIEIDLDATLPDGKGETHGLVDLYFWADFYDASRQIRVRDAIKLAKLAFSEDDKKFQSFMADIPRKQCAYAQHIAHWRSSAFIQTWEKCLRCRAIEALCRSKSRR